MRCTFIINGCYINYRLTWEAFKLLTAHIAHAISKTELQPCFDKCAMSRGELNVASGWLKMDDKWTSTCDRFLGDMSLSRALHINPWLHLTGPHFVGSSTQLQTLPESFRGGKKWPDSLLSFTLPCLTSCQALSSLCDSKRLLSKIDQAHIPEVQGCGDPGGIVSVV